MGKQAAAKRIRDIVTKARQETLRIADLYPPRDESPAMAALRQAVCAEARDNPVVFAQYVFRDPEGRPWRMSSHHRRYQQFITDNRRGVILAPAEHGKTQQFMARTLHRVCSDRNTTAAWVSNTQGMAKKPVRAIREHIQMTREVSEVFPDLCPGEVWQDAAFTLGGRTSGINDPTLQALGVHGAIMGSRLSWVVVDDPCDFENTRTHAGREDLYRWFQSSVLSRLLPGASCFVVATAWHPEDLAHRLIADGWPCIVDRAILPDGTPLWPEQWSVERLEDRKREMGSFEFARVYLNEVYDDSTSRFKREWFDKAFQRGSRGVQLELYAVPPDCHIVVGVDLAVKERPESDYTAFVVVLVGPDRHRTVLTVEAGHYSSPEILAKMSDIHRRYKDPLFYVENNAAQDYILQMARHLSIATVRPHHTGGGKASLQWEAEKWSAEMEQGMWTLPGNGAGGPATEDVGLLMREALTYHPEAHVGDRLAALLFARAHADEGFGRIGQTPSFLFGRG